MGKADLHIHTTVSDGLCKPEEVLGLAADHALESIAITDHDSIDGYLATRKEAARYSVKLIPGAEFTVQKQGRTIHVLAYYFDPDRTEFKQLLNRQRRARLNRMEEILKLLRQKEGIGLEMDEVKAQARNNNVGRPHVAKLLIRKRIVATVQEAFIRFLGRPYINELETDYVQLEELIQLVGRAGGVTSLAHPGPLYSEKEVIELVDEGIDGIECIHPSHDFDQQRRFTRLAEKRQLLVTGGSDFHGSARSYSPWFGVVTLSGVHVAALHRMAENRKNLN